MRTVNRMRLAVALAAAIVIAVGCQETLPSAPDTVVEGITIYEHANYSGDSALLKGDVSDLKEYKGPCEHLDWGNTSSTYYYDWNDCISSIKVAPGWRATIFVDTGFHDDWLELTADVPDLALVRGSCTHDTWNDCISSIRVRQQ